MHDVIAFRSKPSTSGAIDVLEARFDELHTLLALTKATIERYAPETGSDAPHWLLPICEVIDELKGQVERAQCKTDGCGSLATHLVGWDRYCEPCRDALALRVEVACGCGATLTLDEAAARLVDQPWTCPVCEQAARDHWTSTQEMQRGDSR